MIFILDDDDGVRDSLRLLLECEGFEAREFASCLEFLNAGRGGDGDCLVLDLHMPEMSGIELLEGMRQRGICSRSFSSLGGSTPQLGSAPVPPVPSPLSRSPIRPAKS